MLTDSIDELKVTPVSEPGDPYTLCDEKEVAIQECMCRRLGIEYVVRGHYLGGEFVVLSKTDQVDIYGRPLVKGQRILSFHQRAHKGYRRYLQTLSKIENIRNSNLLHQQMAESGKGDEGAPKFLSPDTDLTF